MRAKVFDKVFVAGHGGMLGSAIVRKLNEFGLAKELITKSRDELDLGDQASTFSFLAESRPSHVIIAAAKVGGIHASMTYPADFIYENTVIAANLLKGCVTAGVDTVLFIGSSCIYPRDSKQPMEESSLLSGHLEPTNEPYALAKIVGIKMCESFNRQYGCDFRSVQPSNLFGPGDRYHPENSHVIPALIGKFHKAVEDGADSVTLWGTGKVRREFLYSDDAAEGCLHVLSLPKETYHSSVDARCSHVNLGSGKDCSIQEIAELIAEMTGFTGKMIFDTSKPDGHPRKLLDVSLAERLGWKSRIDLKDGLRLAYEYYIRSEVAGSGDEQVTE